MLFQKDAVAYVYGIFILADIHTVDSKDKQALR